MTRRANIWAEVEALVAPFGVSRTDLIGDSHYRPCAWSRQMAYAYVYRVHGLNKSHIGRMFGGRDPTTVRHGVEQHEARMAWAEFLKWAAEPRPYPQLLSAMSRFTVCCKAAADRMRLAA